MRLVQCLMKRGNISFPSQCTPEDVAYSYVLCSGLRRVCPSWWEPMCAVSLKLYLGSPLVLGKSSVETLQSPLAF